MQINQTTPAMQSLLTSTPVNKAQTASAAQVKEPVSDMQKLANKYDINNISYDEMSALSMDLLNHGALSPKEVALMNSMTGGLQHFESEGGNARIDAVNVWEGMIDFEKTQSGSIGTEHKERALELFHGMEALRHSNITRSI